MSVYDMYMPYAFPYVTILNEQQVKEAVTALMDNEREDVPIGSSFAVTVDYQTQMFCFWMSEVTFKFCYDAMLEGMWRTKGGYLNAPQLLDSRDFKESRLKL